MYSVKIIAVGKLKEDWQKTAAAKYEKRLSGYCKLETVEIKECRLSDAPSEREIEAALIAEGRAILEETKGVPFTALCIEGKKTTSEGLSEKIRSAASAGRSKLVFVIGSSFGLSKEVKTAASARLSMSDMTFPHMLARVMLLEQIYRAFSILNNGKYHK